MIKMESNEYCVVYNAEKIEDEWINFWNGSSEFKNTMIRACTNNKHSKIEVNVILIPDTRFCYSASSTVYTLLH